MAEVAEIGADRDAGALAAVARSGVEVIPMAGSLGAVVRGVDLADVGEAAFAAVRQAFLDHKALVFRDQHITPAQQIAWTERFGPVERQPLYRSKVIEDHPEILVLEHKAGEWINGRNDVWHCDITFGERPPLGSALYCRAIRTGFGDTMFSDMKNAYEALSGGMRRLLDTLTAEHDSLSLIRRNNTQGYNVAIGNMPPSVAHPVVRTHPETGAKCLFVNSAFTRRFTGMTEKESQPPPRVPLRPRRPARLRLPPPLACRRRGHVGQPLHHSLRSARLRPRHVPPHAPHDGLGRPPGVRRAATRHIEPEASTLPLTCSR